MIVVLATETEYNFVRVERAEIGPLHKSSWDEDARKDLDKTNIYYKNNRNVEHVQNLSQTCGGS